MRWWNSFSTRRHSRWLRIALLALYYLLVQLALFALYAYKDFAAPSYIYQEF